MPPRVSPLQFKIAVTYGYLIGCALGMEDAGMLAILLPLGTTIDDIPARLAAHQELRKERVERISNLTDFQLHFDTGKEVVCTGQCYNLAYYITN